MNSYIRQKHIVCNFMSISNIGTKDHVRKRDSRQCGNGCKETFAYLKYWKLYNLCQIRCRCYAVTTGSLSDRQMTYMAVYRQVPFLMVQRDLVRFQILKKRPTPSVGPQLSMIGVYSLSYAQYIPIIIHAVCTLLASKGTLTYLKKWLN